MFLRTFSNGFEAIHRVIAVSFNLSTDQGDLLLAVAFALLCALIKRMCNAINVELGYGTLEKLRDVAYNIIIRFWLTLYSTSLCLSKDYFWDTSLYWKYPDGALRQNGCTREVQTDERLYYVTLFGYFLNHTLMQFSVPRREDFYALFVHHIVTLCLIMMSYKSGFTSIGVVVAMCHEPSDLFLVVAKMFRYLGITLITDVFFLIFIISWFYLRMYLYPVKCIIATVAGPLKMSFHSFLPFLIHDPPHCVNRISELSLYLMVCLYLLNLYWAYFIVKSIIRKILTGKTEDTRSGDERNVPQGGVKLD